VPHGDALTLDHEAFAFDARLGRLVLIVSGSLSFDLGANAWQPLHPAAPGPSFQLTNFRQGTYDPVRGTVAILGQGQYGWELAEYDAIQGTWHDSPTEADSGWMASGIPSPGAAVAAYDTARHRLVLLSSDGTVFERPSQ
jgi:hypothetical protein